MSSSRRYEGAGETLLSVSNDILDFSKIEAGRLQLESIPLELHTVLEGAFEVVHHNAHQKNLELELTLDVDVPVCVCGDPGRLRQVLVNLLANAVKFTESGRVELRVCTHQRDGRTLTRFEGSDTGIGISPEIQATLFSAFTQADASTTRRFGGTGLGLAISSRLIDAMGGEIGLASVPGAGSTFWVNLPLPSDNSGPLHPDEFLQGRQHLS